MKIIAHFRVKEQYGTVRFFPCCEVARSVMTLIGAKSLQEDSPNWNAYKQAMKNLNIDFSYEYKDISF